MNLISSLTPSNIQDQDDEVRIKKIQKLRNDPCLFSRSILDFRPYSYQESLLRDQSKRICACMGRQTGKSTTIAAKAIWFGTTHPKTNTLIVSATLRQSILMFDKVVDFITSSPLKKSISYRSRTRIRLKNGSWIIALPCGHSGYSLRGHTAHLVILDECAFIPEDVITNVVFPMVSTTDGSVWMLSTPWDRDHIFYRCFVNRGEWSVYHLPSSVNPIIKREFLEEQKELIGEERFAIEYEAKFVDDGRSFFPMTILRPCIRDYAPSLEGSTHFGGYDPGGRESYAAFVTVRKSGTNIVVTYLKAEKGKSYSQFTVEINDLHRHGRLKRLLIDQTGTQAAIVEHAKDLGLPAEGITLTDRVREEVLTNLKLLFEQKRIMIPSRNELLNALNCIEYERTRLGGYRFTHRHGTYDDLAYALALACYAAKDSGGLLIKL